MTAFTVSARAGHPLCQACRFKSVCKMVTLNTTYCEGFSQRGRDAKINGARITAQVWGERL